MHFHDDVRDFDFGPDADDGFDPAVIVVLVEVLIVGARERRSSS